MNLLYRSVLISVSVATVSIVIGACGDSNSDAIGTLPILNTIQRTVPLEMQTTTTAAVEVPYTVQKYDTLFEIARAFGVDMDDLASYNGIGQDEYDSIQAGQVLKIPNPKNPTGTFAPQ